MIIKAERLQIKEDTDNNLWLIDFRDEKRELKGSIEIPSKIVSMEESTELEIEIISRDKLKEPLDNSNSRIVFNAKTFRTKTQEKEKTYSFSAGGIMLRLFSKKAISEFKGALKEFIIIVH